MAKVSAGLEIMDEFSRPLYAYNKALQTSVSQSERLKSVMSSGMDNSIRRNERLQSDFNDRLKEGSEESSEMLANMKGIAAAYLSIGAAGKLFSSTLGGAFEIQDLTAQIEVQTGIDEAQARSLMQDVRDIYTSGFGESMSGISADISTVRQNMAGLSQEATEAFTQSAYVVQKVSQGTTDVAELSKVTRNLMANFKGLGETEALDLITTGFQQGGNYAGDLLDTVNEYAMQFSSLDMSAEQAFATLIAGSKEGAWNLDKVGDGVKESWIRMQDLSATSERAFKAIGLDADKMAEDIAMGGEKANQAYQATLLALGNVDDALVRNSAGVDLFGTQWEDLGSRVITAMAAGQQGLEGFEGATDRAMEALVGTSAFQLEVLKRNFKDGFAGAGQGALESLAPIITMLNEMFANGQMDAFFANIAVGIDYLVQSMLWLYNTASIVYNFFAENWGWLGPIFMSLGEAILMVWGAIKLAALAQAVWNAVMNMNPIMLIITLFIAFIMWIYNMWKTNDAFAAGFLRVWNGILNFFGKIPIFFAKVGFGIADAFNSAKATSLQILQNLANGAIDIINSLISKLNAIPGVSISLIDQVTFAAGAAAEAEASRQANAAKVAGMEADAAATAAQREQSVLDMINNREVATQETAAAKQAAQVAKLGGQLKDNTAALTGAGAKAPSMASADAGRAAQGAGDIGKVGKVDKVGKIEKEVDISSEDLKTMRELAEMKNIQNFVTLTPTVQVTTGDINNGTDIDTIIERIETVMTEQITTHASGVYNGG